MKRIIHLSIFLSVFTLFAFGQKPKFYKEGAIPREVERIRKEYNPDKSLNVYDISVEEIKGTVIISGKTSNQAAYEELSKLAQMRSAENKVQLLPDSELGEKTYGVIRLSVADIRTQNKFTSGMATQAILGTPIRILQKDGWYQIQLPDGYVGWAQASNFEAMTKDEFNVWTNARKIIFTDFFGFAYEDADTSAQTVSDLVSGNMLKLEGEVGKFYKVSYPDGRMAYVLKEQSKLMEDWLSGINATGENFVKKAKTFMGIPYVWGGTSIKGMDCSGLTKTVLFMHGIILLRDASQQVYTGTPIDISNGYHNLVAGDLMFFGKKAESEEELFKNIRHVAFYIGNNEFIHASGCIRVSSLDTDKPNYDEVNTKEFVWASRIPDAVGTKGIWNILENTMYQPQK